VGILDVVDRVLVRLLLRQFDVEIDRARRAARCEEPAGRVDPDLLEQVVERDELAGPLGHRDLDPVADEADP
jgi:hypothetical protein